MFQNKKKKEKEKKSSRYSPHPYIWNKEITLQKPLSHRQDHPASIAF